MEAIVRACADEGWPAQVAAVIANRPDAAGLAFAASHGIATAVVDHRQFPDRESFDAALARQIDSFAPDLVVLAAGADPARIAEALRWAELTPAELAAGPGEWAG